MSQWTHIRGGFELESPAVELDKCKIKKPGACRTKENDEEFDAYWQEVSKKAYYPFPDEQFKVGVPILIDGCFDGSHYIKIDAYEYSLPRARKYLKEAFEMLPQGELGWHYSILQDNTHCGCSSSYLELKCSQKAFKEKVLELYAKDGLYDCLNFKELEKYQKIKMGMIDHVHNFVIGIREDLRYCSGKELQEALEKFFMYLEQHDITVEDGYLEWEDEWDDNHIYAWRHSRISHDTQHEFLLLDKKTNKILHSKVYKWKEDEKGNVDWDAVDRHDYEIVETDYSEK